MKALLDTNILAELVKPNGNPAVKAALDEIPTSNVFLSVLTVGEIVKGIALLASGQKKKHLTKWLAGLENQVRRAAALPLDVETARIWGELTARTQKAGVVVPPTDGLLAATALRHGLHVMTRNTKHFEASGLVVAPWQSPMRPLRRATPIVCRRIFILLSAFWDLETLAFQAKTSSTLNPFVVGRDSGDRSDPRKPSESSGLPSVGLAADCRTHRLPAGGRSVLALS